MSKLVDYLTPMAKWLECLPMFWETGVQSQVELYEKLKKLYLIPPCLIPSIIRHGSRVSEAIHGKENYPPLNLGVAATEKGAIRSLSTTVGQLIYIYIYIYTAGDRLCKHNFRMSLLEKTVRQYSTDSSDLNSLGFRFTVFSSPRQAREPNLSHNFTYSKRKKRKKP